MALIPKSLERGDLLKVGHTFVVKYMVKDVYTAFVTINVVLHTQGK